MEDPGGESLRVGAVDDARGACLLFCEGGGVRAGGGRGGEDEPGSELMERISTMRETRDSMKPSYCSSIRVMVGVQMARSSCGSSGVRAEGRFLWRSRHQ